MSGDPWLGPEESIRLVVTLVVMDGYASSVITDRVETVGVEGGGGSKTKLEGINLPANGTGG